MRHREKIYEYRLNIIDNSVVIVRVICIIYGTRIRRLPLHVEEPESATDVIHPKCHALPDMEE